MDIDTLWQDFICKAKELSTVSSTAMFMDVIVKVSLEFELAGVGGVVSRCCQPPTHVPEVRRTRSRTPDDEVPADEGLVDRQGSPEDNSVSSHREWGGRHHTRGAVVLARGRFAATSPVCPSGSHSEYLCSIAEH